jgi:hypothetical protein
MIRVLRAAPLLLLTLGTLGCGAKPVPVSGVVTLDGKAVEGATVSFVTADGKQSATGFTDGSGAFSLTTADQSGAFPGEYKIVVTRSPKTSVVADQTPGSADYMKHMKKESAEQTKGGSTPGDAMKMKMIGGKGPAAPGSTQGVKSDLPAAYASTATTPLTAKVPPDNQPIQIDLKSK